MMICLLTTIFLHLLSPWNANAKLLPKIGGRVLMPTIPSIPIKLANITNITILKKPENIVPTFSGLVQGKEIYFPSNIGLPKIGDVGVSTPTTPSILKPINPANIPNITILERLQNIVPTFSGLVQGKEIYFPPDIGPSVQQYLGIPYARPPVGRLRFRKPKPVTPWIGVLDATKQPPGCIQYSKFDFPWLDRKDNKSEDCLFLNIWTIKHQIKVIPAPVMVWIYGGGFTTGSIRQNVYNGSGIPSIAFSKNSGPLVFVSINYRVGAFGFLNAGTASAPGNMGLHDIILALRWIKLNIRAFGGDPSKITIAGQGSGAVAVGLLCVSPLAKGLFLRAIMESGSPAYLFAENNSLNTDKSQKLAEALGCTDEDTNIYDDPEKVVKCLRDVDAMKIAKTLNSFDPTAIYSFYPNYGDDILPQNARKALIDGNFKNADVLIGVNRDEGANLLTTANPRVFGFFGEKYSKINKTYGESLLRNYFRDFEDPDAVVQHYLGDIEDDNDYYVIRRQVYTAIGDYSILCPTEYFADTYKDAGNRVYFYFLNNRGYSSRWAKWMGVTHFDGVEFLFGEVKQRLMPKRNPQQIDSIILSNVVITYWNQFVHGRMEDISDIWPMYTGSNGSVYGFFPLYGKKDYNADQQVVDVPHRDNCNFFREYFGFS